MTNSIKVTGDSNGLTDNVSDTSDDGDDTDGNTEDDPTITFMEPDGKVEATKTFEIIDSDGDGETSVGDVIRFIIQIENIGSNMTSWNIFLLKHLTILIQKVARHKSSRM